LRRVEKIKKPRVAKREKDKKRGDMWGKDPRVFTKKQFGRSMTHRERADLSREGATLQFSPKKKKKGS